MNPWAYKNLILLAFLFSACGKLTGDSDNNSAGVNNVCNLPNISASTNVLPVQVGSTGSLCGTNVNIPCTTVKVCTPGTSTCQSISDILVDTGSSGLRVFSSVLSSVTPTPITDTSGNAIAECAQFGIGEDWGPLMSAGVQLGEEDIVEIPIQVINRNYATRPSACANADDTPIHAGFNGILGVGLFSEDCGSYCASHSNNGFYYSCAGSNCTEISYENVKQVQNPVAHLLTNNNGVILQFPGVSPIGASSVSGNLVLGIGTSTNNIPPGCSTFFQTSSSGNFITQFNGTTYTHSFIDSGSNGLFFPQPTGLTTCSSGSAAEGFFCPTSLTSYTAINLSIDQRHSNTVSFQIGNTAGLISNGNLVFNDIGAPESGSFDWGFPFFLGRTIFVGIEGTQSSLGTGPYWAY